MQNFKLVYQSRVGGTYLGEFSELFSADDVETAKKIAAEIIAEKRKEYPDCRHIVTDLLMVIPFQE
ncbi:MAG: hypothetical protein A3E37_02670 [Candidatus Andersenbacteria bacterium RIFCSPHIGHO2_12_FULL_46_9]|nr:MAG: hypothetical protein A3B76_00740 [Candidatus Andersenbacteria bacterium RIFCSPHIGHO2_02_FULL_46_16]OGY37420.1 MAG: hypothetical protein A3E37_02670 [Candidatus Andersenbacteria bacterium RIFCSPHIGHO2_12_FULL_46_9]OGY37440.1 MAG: hypothetical protein A3I08_00145 [Candidatus Andersenbacteria bacterium RIFCSPLOWO2_02_FULL_46_11]